MLIGLEGLWQADIGDGKVYPMNLPGTLDENGIGHRDAAGDQCHPEENLGTIQQEKEADAPISTRFTRKYTYEGPARFIRRFDPGATDAGREVFAGKRIFLEAERARALRLFINGSEVPEFKPSSLSTPHVFEVTGLLEEECEIMLESDNSYPEMSRKDIVYSSAATDETQTNWNGIVGYLRLRTEDSVFVDELRVYPKENTLTVEADVCASEWWKGEMALHSPALKAAAFREISVKEGRETITFDALPLKEDIKRWDEYEGNLYELSASLSGFDIKTVTFGVRDFGKDPKGRLALNGRAIFLRSEANCCVFPETGYEPATTEEWMEVLKTYQSYGVNCMRFHSHCPPEAAFAAADRMGILMQPELSHWNPKDVFESEESVIYYRRELAAVIRSLANHPSFVMLTLGNELQGTETGRRRMSELVKLAQEQDSTRMYANGSNNAYNRTEGCDPDSDFFTSMRSYGEDLRGTFDGMKGYINHRYPNTENNFDQAMAHIRQSYQGPVFGFEVGQFEILPDFEELKDFKGVTSPANLELIQERVKERGLEGIWKKYVEATGELSLLGYREEVEAAMRTEQFSGLSLLGLQDFPGQGTALVGMLNSHLKPKPYDFARPERFRAFFRQQQLLALMPKYTYENTEEIKCEVRVANFGKKEMTGHIVCELRGENFRAEKGTESTVICPVGELTKAGTFAFDLKEINRPCRLELVLSLEKDFVSELSHSYPVWVYPAGTEHVPVGVFETEHFGREAKQALEEGKTVYLTPPSTREAMPQSIQAQFTTDFWSVGTFHWQEGGMGQLIDNKHPLFENFPTEFHTNWQWWPMAVQRAVILPEKYEAIVTEMDSYAYLRPMAQLLECRCGGGKLLFSTMGLQNLQQYPEARALLNAIYRYLDSEKFAPAQEISPEVFEKQCP